MFRWLSVCWCLLGVIILKDRFVGAVFLNATHCSSQRQMEKSLVVENDSEDGDDDGDDISNMC